MAIIDAFHSVKEEEKPLLARRYHNSDECAIGREIPDEDRRDGNGGYTLCEDCAEA